MTTAPAPLSRPSAYRPLRLATLVRLRWLALAGQVIGIGVVHFGLGYPVPLLPCVALIALSAMLNLALALRVRAGRGGDGFPAAQLAFDLVQLGGLLWLTGGLHNPFAVLLLAPVSVAATALSLRTTLLLTLLAGGIATLLAVSHLPLPWDPAAPIRFHPVYLLGIWASVLCGIGFVAFYTNSVAHEARQLADALAATELALSRQQQLSALDGLAAAAAHELGTPLSTIALAAREMRADLADGPLAEDADLILEQIARCRAILTKLRKLDAEGGDPFVAVPLGELIAEVARPYRDLGKTVRYVPDRAAEGEPVLVRNVGLLYGLGNLIENAVHFARTGVVVEGAWDTDQVALTIIDDGPGFPSEVLARLGEPYLTTRPRDRADADDAEPGGLGLGVFIAKTLLERSGARLSFSNAASGGHARVDIVWPRGAL